MRKELGIAVVVILLLAVLVWINKPAPSVRSAVAPSPTPSPSKIPTPSPTAAAQTTIVQFDPSLVEITASSISQVESCTLSTIVPNPRVFQCVSTTHDKPLDPCFIYDDETLLCEPDPSGMTSDHTLFTIPDTLPESTAVAHEPVAFFVQLNDSQKSRCTKIVPLETDAHLKTYKCSTPDMWIVNKLDTKSTQMTAETVTLKEEINTGAVAQKTPILKVWIY